MKYSSMILDQIKALDPNSRTLVFFLITGGGSALFSVPPEGISIDELFRMNELLMHCGANIYDINTIRKHVSQVKGGRFGQLCSEHGATVISLILSDVVGDDLSVIASGPTYGSDTFGRDSPGQAVRHLGLMPESIGHRSGEGPIPSRDEPPGAASQCPQLSDWQQHGHFWRQEVKGSRVNL